MKACRKRLTKKCREILKANSVTGADGYLLPPPDRTDIKIMSLGCHFRMVNAYD